MKGLLKRFWMDDQGALIASEWLFVATILVIGIIVGLASVRDAVVTELAEFANALLALSQGYSISGMEGCCSATDGSEAIDTPGLVPEPICTPPAIPSVIDVLPCNKLASNLNIWGESTHEEEYVSSSAGRVGRPHGSGPHAAT